MIVPRLPRARWWVALGVVAIAAVLRLAALGSPGEAYFDETYYANDARLYLIGTEAYDSPLDFNPESPPGQPPPSVALRGERSYVHPPLGKWVIAAGDLLALRTDSLWGFRLSSAIFGIGTVLLVYLIGLEIFGSSVVWAGLAALFAALDGLLIVQSRVSMLDGILAGFVCLGVWCLLHDRRQPNLWWRLGGGAALGAAVATKWSGALALVAAAAFTLAWSIRRGGWRREWWTLAVAFVALPVVIYVSSFGAFFAQKGASPSAFWDLHKQMLDYHSDLDQGHTYQSPPSSWPIMRRPVAYYYDEQQGTVHHIVALGNPGLWWPFLIAAPALLALAFTRSGWGARVVFGFYAAQYLPWFVAARSRTVQFLFYMTPAVPFMALGLVLTIRAINHLRFRRAAAVAATLLVVAGIALWLPVWIGYGVKSGYWRQLMIFRSWI